MFARNILPKIHLLCVLALVKSQNYDYSGDEGGTESEAQEQTPDYSKFYSVTPKEGASSFGGFAQPQTAFSFEPYEAFGASSQDKKKVNINQGFAPVQSPTGFSEFFSKNIYPGNQQSDYFEQAQKRKQEENQEEPSDEVSEEKKEQNEEDDEKLESSRRGANYISHEIPTKIPHQVETVEVKENLKINNYNYVNPSTQETQQNEYKRPQNHAVDFKYLPHLQPLISQQKAELYPQASGIHNLPLQSLPSTPYQKYSFQPVGRYQNKYLENLNSATHTVPKTSKLISQIESQESKVQPKSTDRKNCIKMKRNSGDKHIADLTCFVCENKETNSKVTECSYQSEPDSTDLLKGSSQRYSVPAKNDAFRYRRATSEEEETDPYEYVKKQSLKAQNEKEDSDDLYSFEGYEESQPEKSYSEIQSEEILKDSKKCTDVLRDGMSCRVCKDPASGGNFESCSYTSAPKPDKYAYVSEKNYNSNDDPQNANEEGESKNVPVNAKISSSSQKNTPKSRVNTKESRNGKQTKNRESRHKNIKGSESKQRDHIYSQKSDKKDAENEQNKETEYPFSELSDGAESRQEAENAENENQEESDENKEASEDESPYSEIGEYNFKYFPEFSLPKSEKEEPLDYEASSKKEVEDVLADFKKRDRSQCQQTKKNGMTCFLCVGENKVKNEECMFISESKPKGTIAKYTKDNGIVSTKMGSEPADSKEELGESETKRKDVIAAASSEVETRVKAPSRRRSKSSEQKASASAPDSQRLEEKDDEPKLQTPTEFQTTDEEGAYSAETKPVYSKTLGMSLPQYMLEKSEFEKEFDASSKYH